jgi:hypothetical protein
MSQFIYPFSFTEDLSNPIIGKLELDESKPYTSSKGEMGAYRLGRISIENTIPLDLVLYHNDATARFMYVRDCEISPNFLAIIDLKQNELKGQSFQSLPGQLCLGSDRSHLIGAATNHLFGSTPLASTISSHSQENLAVFPIAREGLKYQVAEAIYANAGYFCDEIVLDAHHVFDSSVPVYNRTVELTLFKDKDLDRRQKENITVAFLADSIASGLVMKEVIARVSERFENLERIEVISPLATIRGLCRIAQSEVTNRVPVRVHVFETLLNALPPDFYYSAHFKEPKFHFDPVEEANYRAWWGKDADGNAIADTACAGYGWSEVFYSPRKQIQMMNSQLMTRHGITIADIIRRNIKP